MDRALIRDSMVIPGSSDSDGRPYSVWYAVSQCLPGATASGGNNNDGYPRW